MRSIRSQVCDCDWNARALCEAKGGRSQLARRRSRRVTNCQADTCCTPSDLPYRRPIPYRLNRIAANWNPAISHVWKSLRNIVWKHWRSARFPRAYSVFQSKKRPISQCSLPCHNATYDNEAMVRRMVDEQNDMRVPAELVPNCPKCGSPMSMNLRADATFVEDEGWHEAASQFDRYMRAIFFGR